MAVCCGKAGRASLNRGIKDRTGVQRSQGRQPLFAFIRVHSWLVLFSRRSRPGWPRSQEASRLGPKDAASRNRDHLAGGGAGPGAQPLTGSIRHGTRKPSAQTRCGLRTDGVLSGQFPPPGVMDDWAEWLRQEDEENVVAAIRRHTNTGHPCGSPEFVARLRARLGRTLQPRKAGRRPKNRITTEYANQAEWYFPLRSIVRAHSLAFR